MCDRVIDVMRPSWRNEKHAAQWEMTLREYAASLRRLPVDKITTDDVLGVLKPLWNSKPETAARVRGRISSGCWMPQRRKGSVTVRTQRDGGASQPGFAQAPAAYRRASRSYVLYRRGCPSWWPCGNAEAVALRPSNSSFSTAARSGEVLRARWEEFDLDGAVWTVPAIRMRPGREHRVPLSKRALRVVKDMHEVREGDFVFPGQKAGAPLSIMALEMVLRRMKLDDVTVHGFRSSFRDWAAECTNFPNEVCEAALAHVIENKAEAAYRRGDLFDKRRKLMENWATYCGSKKLTASTS